MYDTTNENERLFGIINMRPIYSVEQIPNCNRGVSKSGNA